MARLLLVGIDYYHYIAHIRKAFERLGYETDWYPVENAGFWAKSLKRVFPRVYRTMLDAYHRRLIARTARTRYDVVVFIQCHHVTPENMSALRASHAGSRFILYNWDSLTTHDYRPWLRFFDRAATFDPADAEALGIHYRPLFAIPDFFAIDRTKPVDFDLYFVGAIGTVHRFDALVQFYEYCRTHQIRTYFHLKCSPAVRWMLWRSGRSLPGITLSSMPFSGIVDLIARSRGVFDFANHRQTGYTMRLIENLCAEEKIVTENERISDEDFFRADRILVVRDFDFSRVKAFLDEPIVSGLDTARFSIDSWARELLEV